MNGKGLVPEVFFAVEVYDFIQIGSLAGQIIHLSPFDAGIDKRSETDLGHHAHTFCRDFPVELYDHSLGKTIGEHFVVLNERPDIGRSVGMSSDETL